MLIVGKTNILCSNYFEHIFCRPGLLVRFICRLSVAPGLGGNDGAWTQISHQLSRLLAEGEWPYGVI